MSYCGLMVAGKQEFASPDPDGTGMTVEGSDSGRATVHLDMGDHDMAGERYGGSHGLPATVTSLYKSLREVLARAFPRNQELWIQGEIQKVNDYFHKSGHCYIDIVDPDSPDPTRPAVLNVKCWKSTWLPLRRRLADEGLELQAGMHVIIRGYVDFYEARGEINFVLQDLDLDALLGRLALERKRLIETLRKAGLLEMNKSKTMPLVPLRVGLVASPGTEGYSDFLGALEKSGYSFRVTVAPAQVQGRDAPQSLVTALDALEARAAALDVVAIVRGGGAKSDLAAFDAEAVAGRVATMSVPVWTGIGHTGDESVADLVAHSVFITPTSCGLALVAAVSQFLARVEHHAGSLASRATEVLRSMEDAGRQSSVRLARAGNRVLDQQSRMLAGMAGRLAIRPQSTIARHRERLVMLVARLALSADRVLTSEEERLDASGRLVHAYDPRRQLERGYSLTWIVDAGVSGGRKLVRSVAEVRTDQVLLTSIRDGELRSVVAGIRESE
jgi:exodeoxyribonuclease VII large subunit